MKAIAICISGLSRCVHQTLEHVYESMIRPVEAHSDVYLALSNITRDMSILNPIWAKTVVSKTQWDGFRECHTAIEYTERLKQERYAYIMRLRTDVVYDHTLPPFPWPNAPSLTLFTTEIFGDLYVNDIWMLMARPIFDKLVSTSKLAFPGRVHKNELRVCKAVNTSEAFASVLDFHADIKRCYAVNRRWRRESLRAAVSIANMSSVAFHFHEHPKLRKMLC